jgi:hypothetical protein
MNRTIAMRLIQWQAGLFAGVMTLLSLPTIPNVQGDAISNDSPYTLETFTIPESLKLEVSGLALLPDGSMAIAIRKGEIWIASQTNDPTSTRYRKYASGLHEPLGLAYRDGALYTVQRTELTRIRDTDEDGFADEYWTIAKGWGVTGNYHEYAYGPQFDDQGNAWITLNIGIGKGPVPEDTAWRGWSIKVTPDGSWQPVSGGFRSPSGMGLHPDGGIFATDQQGNWFPTCPLLHVQSGVFHGHADALEHCRRPEATFNIEKNLPKNITVVEAAQQIPAYQLPPVWFPYRTMGMSATDVLWDTTDGKFGPFAGQAFVGEFTMSMILRVYLEKVEDVYQGACFRFAEGLQCGALRLAWDAQGGLIIGETNRGWNSLGHRSFGMERLSWAGSTPFEIHRINAQPGGFKVTFTKPLGPDSGITHSSVHMRSYTYHYHSSYGSEEIDQQTLNIRSSLLSKDRRVMNLDVDGLREGYVHEMTFKGLRSSDDEPLDHAVVCYTLNRIPRSAQKE